MIRWAMALVAALLLLPATAQGGGWATVGVSSLPDGQAAGEPWVVDLTIRQHGRTPLDGVRPRVLLNGSGGAQRTFGAKPTGKPGVYRASVVFPAEGRWRYAIDDGFSQTHTFAPVRIGEGSTPVAAASVDGSSRGWIAALGVLLGAVALCALVAVLSRLSRRAPRSGR